MEDSSSQERIRFDGQATISFVIPAMYLQLLITDWTVFAAAFFLLGNSLKDAVNVCIRQLDDWQLAVAIARVYEGDDGPILKQIVTEHVLPYAMQNGFRWLASWGFWMIKRRDLAVQALVVS